MRYVTLVIAFTIALTNRPKAQNIIEHAPPGFDSLRAAIPHGKIDTVTYNSKTVGTKRIAVSYTHLTLPTILRV